MGVTLLISEFITMILGSIVIGISIFSRGRNISFKILIFYLIILTALVFHSFLLNSRLIYYSPYLFRVFSPFRFLLGPLVYLFLRTLFQEQNKIYKSDWLHVIPFVIHYIVLIPLLKCSNAEKLSIIQYFEKTYTLNLPSYNIPFFNPHFFEELTLLSFLIYNIIIIRLFLKYKKQFQKPFGLNKPIYRFIKVILITTSASTILLVITPFILSNYESFYTLKMVILILVAIIAIMLLLNPDLLYGQGQSLEIKNSKKRLLSQISFEEAKLLAMSTSSYESNLFLDLNYQVLFFNSLCKINFENTFEQELTIGANFREFLFPEFESKFYAAFAKAVSGSRNEFYALSNINKELREWHIFSFTPIYDARQILLGISITTQNIDAEIKSQNKIRQYIKDLEDIAWKEVHLLNAPISNLLGITKFLLKPESDISMEEQDVLINHISIEVEKLDVVIHEIVNRVNETVKHS